MKSFLLSGLLSTIFFAGAAAAAPLDDATRARLDQLASLEDDAWRAARAEASADAAFVAALREAQGELAFSARSWRADAAALAVLAAAEHPGALQRIADVKGLDPAYYLQARRPIPLASRILPRMDLEVGTLLDAFLFTGPSLIKRTATAYPMSAQGRIDQLRLAEAQALEEGLLTALARTGHPAAVAVLIDELQADSARRQQLAAVLLGETRTETAADVLGELLDRPTVRGALRSASLVGLAKLRSPSAVKRLAREAGKAGVSSDVKLAAIRGLGNAGNRYAHQARPRPNSEAVREAASGALVELLPAVAGDTRLAGAAAEAIATVAHPSAVSSLQALTGEGQADAVQAAARKALRLHARAR